ncbi:MAG: exodeoxyribonuclease III [Alphaproteobacteria bacterium]|nr:exodeoxyribonuclease III [Alphaproteobacteria bacterium]
MKLITWNINSVRLRIGLVERVLKDYNPDVLCLQETKCPDEHFPLQQIQDMGYEHVHFQGMKSYNGLAIISRVPFVAKDCHDRVGRDDCRHISAGFKDFDLHNLYIPAGGDEPDPKVNDKYKHKLDFVEEMTDWFADAYTLDKPVVALGDFNIAPYEHDVWSHKQLLKVVSHTPPETERLAKMLGSLDWIDSARHFIPEEEKTYSWWSYRNRDWKKSNRGRRLDHIWVTQPLKPALKAYDAPSDVRDWEKPSDHVPVILDLDLKKAA